jgi:hypothetical protein
MAVKTQLLHIAVCNVAGCGAEFDETGDYRHWADSPELAIDEIRCAMPDTHWVLQPDDTVICPISDPAHDEARGHESPAVLEAGPDAMVIRFGDGIETRYPAAGVA